MFGNIPPFSSSFPYGPAPSSGVASTSFVDLFNTQTVAGIKTFTSQVNISRDTTASGTEVWFSLTDPSDATAGYTMTSSLGSGWRPLLVSSCNGTGGPGLEARYRVGTDSGTVPAHVIDGRTAADAALTVRPVLSVRNAGTEVTRVSAAGGLVINGGASPSLTVGASGTAITQVRIYSQALDPASVAANTTAEQTFTVTGLTTADKVFVNKPTNTAGLGIVNARVSAADTLALTFGNFTGAPIDAASETYTITAIRS